MVKPEDSAGGAGERAEGRTASELHRADSPGHNHIPGGRGHTIAARLDGTYVADRGGDYEEVHGWFYPDKDDSDEVDAPRADPRTEAQRLAPMGTPGAGEVQPMETPDAFLNRNWLSSRYYT